MNEPLRTCVGCRRILPKAALVRIVLRDGSAVLDEERRRPGRGAWVHRTRACLENAARGGVQRSFRRPVDPAALISFALATASEKS
jgi:predicted RNA-binding protein YlxR (DUF448 family)